VAPGRDDKQLAAWNGMALRALATGALVLSEPRFAAASASLAGFIARRLVRDGDRLWRTAKGDSAHTPAFAEDYANVADGLLAAHAATGAGEHLDLAARLTDRLVIDFWDEESGTLFNTGPEHESAVTRPRSLLDGATPGANSVAADVLQRLALLTGDPDHDRRARSIIRAVVPAIERQPSAFGRMLAAIDRSLSGPIDVVVAGDPADPRARALREAAARPYVPDLVLASVWPEAAHASLSLFAGKTPREGAPTGYVCRGYVCAEPTTEPGRVEAQVRDEATRAAR
jgi:uncharacterized protein YyaL (SSP411 family)